MHDSIATGVAPPVGGVLVNDAEGLHAMQTDGGGLAVLQCRYPASMMIQLQTIICKGVSGRPDEPDGVEGLSSLPHSKSGKASDW